MNLSNDKMFTFLYAILIVCCLIFMYKIIKFIYSIIRHIRCKRKYKNLISNCIQKCIEKEQILLINKGKLDNNGVD